MSCFSSASLTINTIYWFHTCPVISPSSGDGPPPRYGPGHSGHHLLWPAFQTGRPLPRVTGQPAPWHVTCKSAYIRVRSYMLVTVDSQSLLRCMFALMISSSRRQQDDTEGPNRSSQGGCCLCRNRRFVCCYDAGVDTPLPQWPEGKKKKQKQTSHAVIVRTSIIIVSVIMLIHDLSEPRSDDH